MNDATLPIGGATVAMTGNGGIERIGPYKVVRPLGEGGFGAVYEAEQEEPVRRRVAIKILKPGMDTREVIARFEAERQALALMDHPHIARVFDAGETAAGRPYFVMELVPGEPITPYCTRRALPLEQRVELFEQVCAAVHHAHAKGVLHRDLKPGNILVSEHDGHPFAKVIDFGIAKATGERLTDRTLQTQLHVMMGTPLYMSPEQAEGRGDLDARTDVYALGTILYELVTDSTPIASDTLNGAGYAELQRIIRDVEPPLPSKRLLQSARIQLGTSGPRTMDPRRLAARVRGDLDWIVMKAIEKQRARRYATPAALAEDLRNFRAGEHVSAAPPGFAYRLGKLARRHRTAFAAGALVIATALVTMFVLARWSHHEAAPPTAAFAAIPPRSIAVLPFQNLSSDKDNAYFADGMQDMIITKLADIGELKVTSRTSTATYASRPANLRTVAAELGVATVLEGSVQKSGNQVLINVQLIDARSDRHLWAQVYTRTLDNVFGVEGEVAESIAQALKAKLSPSEQRLVAAVPTRNREAWDAFLKAEYEAAQAHDSEIEPAFRRAEADYRRAIALDPGFALAQARLALCQLTRGWFVQRLSETELAEVKATIEHALMLAPDLPEAHLARAYYLYWVDRDYDPALAEFERVVQLAPSNAQALGGLAWVHRRKGDWEQALAGVERTLTAAPRDSIALQARGQILTVLRRYPEAGQALEHAFAVAPDFVETSASLVVLHLFGHGDAARAREAVDAVPAARRSLLNFVGGDVIALTGPWVYPDLFERRFDDALRAWDAVPADTPRRTIDRLSARAAIRVIAGRQREATSECAQLTKLLAPEIARAPSDPKPLTRLAWAQLCLDRRDDAVATARRASELLPPERDALTGVYYLLGLAQVAAWAGRNDDAIAALRRVLARPSGEYATIPRFTTDPVWDPLRKDPRFTALLRDSSLAGTAR